MNDKLLAGFNLFLIKHETFQLALIEAAHRYFYDHCFSGGEGSRLLNTEEANFFFDLHQTLHCKNPDWRFKLKKKLERYHGWEKTNALHIDCKPKRIISITIQATIGNAIA